MCLPLPLTFLATTLFTAAFATEGAVSDPAPDPAPAAARTEQWAGILSVTGTRKIPLLGKVEFETRNYIMAVVTQVDDTHWELDQRTCAIDFPKTLGAEITVDPEAPRKIPHASLVWTRTGDRYDAGPWPSGWDESDFDKDSHPGLTFSVAAPFCGGDLYVSSQARQTATATTEGANHLTGTVRVHVEQTILGARGPCLNLMAKDSAEWMDGRIAYVKVPDDVTCATNTTWPDLPPLKDK